MSPVLNSVIPDIEETTVWETILLETSQQTTSRRILRQSPDDDDYGIVSVPGFGDVSCRDLALVVQSMHSLQH